MGPVFKYSLNVCTLLPNLLIWSLRRNLTFFCTLAEIAHLSHVLCWWSVFRVSVDISSVRLFGL